MARTIFAGQMPFSAGAALQGASDTIGSAMAIENENERHKLSQRAGEQDLEQDAQRFEMDKEAFKLNAKRLEAQVEAESLLTQIRQQTLDEVREASSVERFVNRAAAFPEEAQGIAAAQPDIFEKMDERQTAQFKLAMDVVREERRQTESAFHLGSTITKKLSHAAVNTGEAPIMPGYLEGLQQIQQELSGWQPGAGRDPDEMRAEAAELEKEQTKFAIEHDAINAGLKDFKASYGEGPEMAPVWSMIRAGDFDGAADFAYRTKHPEAYQKTREDAQAEKVNETRDMLTGRFLSGALGGKEPLKPGTPEWDAYMDKSWLWARSVYGEDVVPLTPKERAIQELSAYAAAGIPKEEAKAAIRAGLSVEEYQMSQPPKSGPPKPGGNGFTKPPPILEQGP